MENKKICSKCKTVNKIESKFCIECGNNTFVLPNQKPKYCYSCLIGFTGDVCPICNEDNYTLNLMDLIKKTNRFTNMNDIEKSLQFEEEKKELLYNLKNQKDELHYLNGKYQYVFQQYNHIKNDFENRFKYLTQEINSLESKLEDKKKTYTLLDEETTEIVRKIGVQSISNQAKENNLSSLEKEYNDLIKEKDRLLRQNKELELSLERVKSEYKVKPISADVLEVEAAIYGSLGDYYFNKDKEKALVYYEKSVKLKNNNALPNLILLINDEYLSSYNEKKIIEWNNYAYNVFYKKDQYTTREQVAIATIFSNSRTKYFSKEKAISFIPKARINFIDDKYYIARCYERIGMKEEALKLLEATYQEIKRGYSDKYRLQLFEVTIKRMKLVGDLYAN